MPSDEKLLSAALIAGPCRSRAQKVLDALGRQTARQAMEIVVVDAGPPEASPLKPPEDVACKYVRRPGERRWTALRFELVHLARTPVVAFLEDHCYPSPGWAEALIERHREPWAAVGYAFTNANPVNYISRSAMVSDYGLWMHPVQPLPSKLLPGNNISYRRDTLLSFGDELEVLLSPDFSLQEKLRQMGAPICIEPRALAAHENWPRLGDLLRANYAFSRFLGARRALTQGWSRPRRWFYGIATPVSSPLFGTVRLLASLRGRLSLTGPVLAALPVDLLTHFWSGVGEATGYLLGEGNSCNELFDCELGKIRTVG